MKKMNSQQKENVIIGIVIVAVLGVIMISEFIRYAS